MMRSINIRAAARHFRRSVWPRILYSPALIRDAIYCWWHRLPWHISWRFCRLPIFKTSRLSCLSIGKRFRACSDPQKNTLGVFQRVVIYVAPYAHLSIGDRVSISGCSISVAERIDIGNDVLLGSGCIITDTDAHALHPDDRKAKLLPQTKPVIIEDDVFVGARAIVLKGVTLGKGCVVGAGAVVANSVPPFTVCAGNPAKVIKEIKPRNKSI